MTAVIQNPEAEIRAKNLAPESPALKDPPLENIRESNGGEEPWTEGAAKLAQEEFEKLHDLEEAKTPEQKPEKSEDKKTFWDKAVHLAEVVCSRESVYRTALEFAAFEVPTMLSQALRNRFSFLESVLQSAIAFNLFAWAPKLTTMTAKAVGSFLLPKEMKKNVEDLMLFSMEDLRDHNDFQKAGKKIVREEVNDNIFLARLFEKSKEKAQYYRDRANNIKEFFGNLNLDKALMEKVRELKKKTIVAESFIEGIGWSSIFILTRLFRKYVLKSGFTGVKGYMSEEDSKKIGNNEGYNLIQKIGAGLAMISSPLINFLAMTKTKDTKTVKESKFWGVVDRQCDLTHGKFPKLGLLFSFVQVPAIMGRLFNSQGRLELIEQIIHICTVIPSWWLGHRVTNGVLAKRADNKLSEQFGVEKGILVEPEEVGQRFPEPSKIQHILDVTEHNPELREAARQEHAKVFYAGFASHSILVFAMKMMVNWITKLRAKKALEKPN